MAGTIANSYQATHPVVEDEKVTKVRLGAMFSPENTLQLSLIVIFHPRDMTMGQVIEYRWPAPPTTTTNINNAALPAPPITAVPSITSNACFVAQDSRSKREGYKDSTIRSRDLNNRASSTGNVPMVLVDVMHFGYSSWVTQQNIETCAQRAVDRFYRDPNASRATMTERDIWEKYLLRELVASDSGYAQYNKMGVNSQTPSKCVENALRELQEGEAMKKWLEKRERKQKQMERDGKKTMGKWIRSPSWIVGRLQV